MLVFETQTLERLRKSFDEHAPLESAAFVLARPVRTPAGGWRLIAYDVIYPDDSQYVTRSPVGVDLSPQAVASVLGRARTEKASIILAHSHPGELEVAPSTRDLDGEARLRPVLERRISSVPHGRLIIGSRDVHAAVFTPTGVESLRVVGVGQDVVALTGSAGELNARYDRQIRAFGALGQRVLASLRVAVVGLGGTGSIVAQQLAHLGVRHFFLVDPDTLESTNLNRVVGARWRDAEMRVPKVEIARRMVEGINESATVDAIVGDVREAEFSRRLLDCDFFFGCTDSHGSRAVLTQIAYQYFVPGVDVGVAVHARDGCVTHVSGRVQMLAPGLACLLCGAVLDPEQVRRDLLTEEVRRADPYIVGEAVPQPAVISINSAASSLAVTMMLSAVTGMPLGGRNFRLRFEAGAMKPVYVLPGPRCPVCSPVGALAKGDLWPPPGRRRAEN